MTHIPAHLVDLLACPQCQGALRTLTVGGGQPALACDRCALVYAVEEGIPVLLVERAVPLDDSASG